MKRLFIFLVMILSIVSVDCRNITSPENRIAGNYILRNINDSSLPSSLVPNGATSYKIVGGNVYLHSDDTFIDQLQYMVSYADSPTKFHPYADTLMGTYTVSHDTVNMHSYFSYILHWDLGNRLSVSYSGMTFNYEK